MNLQPIFIHSLFRTGSTYIWNKFRQSDKFVSYYEPFHPELAKIDPQKPDSLAFNRNTLNKMGHPVLDRRFFTEYYSLLKPGKAGVPFFKKSFSFDEFCRNDDNPDLKKYIAFILQNSQNRIPVLQFNRTAFRTPWFKQNYKDSLNIYIVRSPRDQWQSYLETDKKIESRVFGTMDILLSSKNKHTDCFKKLSELVHLIEYSSENTELELLVYKHIADAYSLEEKYFIFYYIWFFSFIENVLHADSLLNVNRLGADIDYQKQIAGLFKKKYDHPLDFSDAKIKVYDRFTITAERMEAIEKNIQPILLDHLKKNSLTERFFSNISDEDKDFFKFNRQWLHDTLQYLPVENHYMETIQDKYAAAFRALSDIVQKQHDDIKEILESYTFRTGQFLLRPVQYIRGIIEKMRDS